MHFRANPFISVQKRFGHYGLAHERWTLNLDSDLGSFHIIRSMSNGHQPANCR